MHGTEARGRKAARGLSAINAERGFFQGVGGGALVGGRGIALSTCTEYGKYTDGVYYYRKIET